MEFHLSQLNNHSASKPYVSRIIIQSADILGAFNTEQEIRDSVLESCMQISTHLAECFEIRDRVSGQIRIGKALIDRGEIKTQMNGQVINVPSVLNLSKEIDMYLVNAKQFLRDVGKIFKIFHQEDFDHNFKKLRKHVLESISENGVLLKVIDQYYPIISQVIDFRNAIEHPKEDNKLIVTDFRLQRVGNDHTFLDPSWALKQSEPKALLADLDYITDNLLLFFEDFLSAIILNFYPKSRIGITEVPENERDQNCPIRLKAILTK